MKLLALETATEACSAAVWVDGVVVERYQLAPRRHAALILPMIEAVLAESGLVATQLDAIAVGRGPGAFTGVRIAIGIAQGIAFAADLPIAPVSTLAALALGAARETGIDCIAAALDARMGEIYWGSYGVANGAIAWQGDERVCAPQAVGALPPGDWYGAGSGWSSYADALAQRLGVSRWQGECYPHAGDVARLAAAPRGRHQWVAAERATPVYLRNEVASKPSS
ncbi:MAG TPA: tRNA (adenosine(37)-N6)-threonylcarbamoyltransferase complex dimerization subunit type 1 TsaB [Candidatus Competibacteraceae bacterium]|nr:MAG: tRNA (adenosine(37)-N6)-threonylcarbamoyltransferase complex dimerization subunit type 1 TsaB [Candidatus Competibacteraceae bacterium]HOB61512.1 tRNA (adenosine(37)-N6)-threonylcarbamoyltransferase complex dimerization subunit type 1 TsaB [Candidatus Competibacteraceae bacterium]HQA25027.1 tRNA (adenosine(37)-N6)-threonylcarbamoyltransferase complex dimerization subunit type 1 TsaB [Candidatus Competibacteraceae bacterium]HQD55954.1 tRNA (adenosine(37)-N6)-threonylcarbamoyltransferase c